MSKKLFTSLAPLVAIAAFVVMPTVAQGEPHYYKDGVVIGAGEAVSTIAWGTLTLETEPKVSLPVTCENAALATIENPEGGGEGVSGKGSTANFAVANCKQGSCEKSPGKEYKAIAEPQSLPWPSNLIAGIRTESTGVKVVLGCFADGTHKGGAKVPETGYLEETPLAEPAVCETKPTVEEKEFRQKPLDVKGTKKDKPSSLLFDAEAGSLACAGGLVKGKTSGKLLTAGYAALELITTKDP